MNKRTSSIMGGGSSTSSSSGREDRTEKDCGCRFDFHIETTGDIHIHNRCDGPAGESGGGQGQGSDYCCPPAGTCLPVVPGAKHKLSRDQKMQRRAGLAVAPSAIAASVIHSVRRFAAGKAPANSLEQESFAILANMPEGFMRCVAQSFETLAPPLRDKLFAPSLLLDLDSAIDGPLLAQAFQDEILQRAGVDLFGVPAAGERPGLNRLYVPQGEDFFTQVRICRINNLRTASFIPTLADSAWLPEEIQQDCAPVLQGDETQVVCQVRTADCPGNTITGVCGRVLDVLPGDSIELEGVNYFNVDGRVRLTDKDTQTITRDVDAFIFGDADTPKEETVNGQTSLINDCRVHDKLTFQVPEDLPPGIYWLQVVMPNNTGNPAFGTELVSNTEFINVLPPINAKFQIVIERIIAREETSPSWWGSDEVGLKTISSALNLALQPLPTHKEKFDQLDGAEFDSGDSRDITTLVFSSDQPILALILGVLGHEIDSEHAYNQQIKDWTDYFVDLVKKQWEIAVAGLGAIGGITALKSLGWWGAIIAGIAIGLTLGIDLIVALWAPADLIIEDTIALTITDLGRMLSPDLPPPAALTFKTPGGIEVNVNKTIPPEKTLFQYRETREYVSDDEDSRYELTYRYNRL